MCDEAKISRNDVVVQEMYAKQVTANVSTAGGPFMKEQLTSGPFHFTEN